jgi:AraC-like DNA-binding protein
VFSYISRFISLCKGDVPDMVVSVKMLLIANFMVVSYILYPIEVISPGWLNFKRILKLYSVWIFLTVVYLFTLWADVYYTPYSSLQQMFYNAERFEVWFRLLLSFLFFFPGLFIFFIYRTRLYNNTDQMWLKKYATVFFINIIAYLSVLISDHQVLHTLYYYISVGCSLYIVYMELFDRLIGRAGSDKEVEVETTIQELNEDSKSSALIERLSNYMSKNSAWRDPNLSLNTLACELYTNRTTLAKVMRENGFDNYTNYINRLRIEDFLRHVESGVSDNFQEAFFYVGFRSRTTALRNFKLFTGKTPSEYFRKGECE